MERFWYWILFSERPRNQRCRGCCVLCRDYPACAGLLEVAEPAFPNQITDFPRDPLNVELRDEPAVPA